MDEAATDAGCALSLAQPRYATSLVVVSEIVLHLSCECQPLYVRVNLRHRKELARRSYRAPKSQVLFTSQLTGHSPPHLGPLYHQKFLECHPVDSRRRPHSFSSQTRRPRSGQLSPFRTQSQGPDQLSGLRLTFADNPSTLSALIARYLATRLACLFPVEVRSQGM